MQQLLKDLPLHEESFMPFIAEFEPSVTVGLTEAIVPYTITGKEGEQVDVQYLNPVDKEKNTVGHAGEVFEAVVINDTNFFPLPSGTVAKFIVQEGYATALLDMEWLADHVQAETPDNFDLREALAPLEGKV
jgi:hypothetical protein